MKFNALTGLLFLLALPAHAATILECERLVDTVDGKVLNDREVRIEGDRIAEVGRNVESAPEDERIALGTCLPGLMDMHVHSTCRCRLRPTSSASRPTRPTTR